MMEKESDSTDLIPVTNDSGITRWAPLIVVLGVIAGFVTLSWYAYHAGIQSVKEEDLVVVEADKTPIKEKPADPGGMQFPNQDKTVFETFAGNNHQPAKVERVLPTPEEPMPKDMDASDTTTWVNDNLPKQGAKEQVIGKETAKKPVVEAKSNYSDEKIDQQVVDHQVIASQAAPEEEQSETYVAPKAASKPFAPEKNPVKEAKTLAKPPVVNASGGAFAVQLGAYRSQAEADAAWEKMHLKQKELSDKQPTFIKADLGAKGVYYRLRITGLASTNDAKTLCHALAAKGQACILPVGN